MVKYIHHGTHFIQKVPFWGGFTVQLAEKKNSTRVGIFQRQFFIFNYNASLIKNIIFKKCHNIFIKKLQMALTSTPWFPGFQLEIFLSFIHSRFHSLQIFLWKRKIKEKITNIAEKKQLYWQTCPLSHSLNAINTQSWLSICFLSLNLIHNGMKQRVLSRNHKW